MIVVEGEAERRFRDLELAYYTAYHAGLFSQQYAKGKFPRYEKGAPKRQKKGARAAVQTWQQQKMVAKALNAAFGGNFKSRAG